MSCNRYQINGWGAQTSDVMFSDADDEFPCLCGYPISREEMDIEPDEFVSLALLGAAVLTAYHEGQNVYIPYDLKPWIVDAARRYREILQDERLKPTNWITTEGEGVWECQGCQTKITATEDEGFLMGKCPACGRPIAVHIVYKD